MLGPRPSSATAPSIWYEEVATPRRNSEGSAARSGFVMLTPLAYTSERLKQLQIVGRFATAERTRSAWTHERQIIDPEVEVDVGANLELNLIERRRVDGLR